MGETYQEQLTSSDSRTSLYSREFSTGNSDLEICLFKACHCQSHRSLQGSGSRRQASAGHLLAKRSDIYSADARPAVTVEASHLTAGGPSILSTFMLQRPLPSRNRVKSMSHKADDIRESQQTSNFQQGVG